MNLQNLATSNPCSTWQDVFCNAWFRRVNQHIWKWISEHIRNKDDLNPKAWIWSHFPILLTLNPLMVRANLKNLLFKHWFQMSRWTGNYFRSKSSNCDEFCILTPDILWSNKVISKRMTKHKTINVQIDGEQFWKLITS